MFYVAVVQQVGDNELKIRTVWVRIPSAAPIKDGSAIHNWIIKIYYKNFLEGSSPSLMIFRLEIYKDLYRKLLLMIENFNLEVNFSGLDKPYRGEYRCQTDSSSIR